LVVTYEWFELLLATLEVVELEVIEMKFGGRRESQLKEVIAPYGR